MTTITERLILQFAKAIGRAPSELVISPRQPLEIQSNRLYDVWAGGSHFIAKEFIRPEELETAPLHEYQALKRLAPLAIAPMPVFFDPTLAPIVIYQYMQGEMWDRRPVRPVDLAKLAEVWLQVHTVEVDWYGRAHQNSICTQAGALQAHCQNYLEWTALSFKPGQQAAEICLGQFERRQGLLQELASEPPVLRFCKGDPRFANVIQRPDGRLGLVDWEDSGLRDPACEIADLITHPNQEDLLGWEDWQAFLGPYLAARSPTDPSLAARIQRYLALFPLMWLALILRGGIRRSMTGQCGDWTINGLPANDRLRRYLARAIAWPDMNMNEALEQLSAIRFFPDA